MDRVKKLKRFLSKKREHPVNWNDVMNRKILFDESYPDEQAGDLLRDHCSEVAMMNFSGGYLFGGATGMKYLYEPTVKEKMEDDDKIKWTRPVVAMNCVFENGHECDLNTGKNSIGDLVEMQSTIKKLALLNELKTWKKEGSSKSKKIVEKIEGLIVD